MTAPRPAGIVGHCGPELRRFVLFQYHQGQVTVPRLLAQLRAIGIAISKRPVVRLLNEGQSTFLDEARDVLCAGLSTAGWISADDTGVRHEHRNAVCNQFGCTQWMRSVNNRFAAFATTSSKSQLNFLDLLRAGHTDHVINEVALTYMRGRSLASSVISQLAAHPQTRLADHAAWQTHLDRLGISTLHVIPDPVGIATEGALWGSIHAHGFLSRTVIVSDDAGQFAVGHHALYWVHAKRLVHKLDAFTHLNRAIQQRIRALIWWFYADHKTYCVNRHGNGTGPPIGMQKVHPSIGWRST